MFQSRIGNELEAIVARRCRGVNTRPVDPHTITRRLNNGIRFGVQRSDAVVVLHLVPYFRTVRLATDAAVVASRENHLIPYDNRTDELAVTGCSGRDFLRNVHEVRVPIDALGIHRDSGGAGVLKLAEWLEDRLWGNVWARRLPTCTGHTEVGSPDGIDYVFYGRIGEHICTDERANLL